MWKEPILHVDMDSFFVEVERLDAPELVGVPAAVGGVGPRGVIASASYEARSFGVRSAQPTATALRLCPHLKVVSPSHGKYGETSVRVFSVFRSITPTVEALSVDEAFLDVSGLTRHFASPVEVAEELRARIHGNLGLPASVGIAATKFVAKLASEDAKPDGVRHIREENQLEFVHSLPAASLWGVGPATLAGLERLGVETIGDIAALPESALSAAVGKSVGRHLHDLARCRDPRPVTPDRAAKSVSVEETYPTDLVGRDLLEAALLAHAQRLSIRLRSAGLAAGTVGIKVRYEDFATVTRSRTAGGAITSARDLYRTARELLADVDSGRPVRLLGLSGASLSDESSAAQLELGSEEGWDRLDEAIGRVRDRFGHHAIEPARLAPDPEESSGSRGG